MMNKAALEKMTVAELRALAKKSKATVPAGAKKADIVRLLAVSPAGKAVKKKTKTKAKAKVKAKIQAKAKAKPKTGAKAGKRTVKGPAKPAAARKARGAAKRTTPAGTAALLREWQVPAGLAAQEEIENAKYFTGTRSRGEGIPAFLPSEYGEDRIVLLARDPETAFGYWEVTPERLQRERAASGADSRLCIRIYDITGVVWDGTNATSSFDQEIHERVGSWYFHLGRPQHVFCADIGVRSPDGRFRTIARSARMTMPADRVSEVLDEEWTLLDEEFLRLYGVHIGPSSGLSSADVQELLRQRRDLGWSSPGAR